MIDLVFRIAEVYVNRDRNLGFLEIVRLQGYWNRFWESDNPTPHVKDECCWFRVAKFMNGLRLSI